MRHWDFDAVGASQIEQPVLYLVGSRSAPNAERVAAMFRTAVPHTDLMIIPDADHTMHMTMPTPVAAAIGAFLAQHPF